MKKISILGILAILVIVAEFLCDDSRLGGYEE